MSIEHSVSPFFAPPMTIAPGIIPENKQKPIPISYIPPPIHKMDRNEIPPPPPPTPIAPRKEPEKKFNFLDFIFFKNCYRRSSTID